MKPTDNQELTTAELDAIDEMRLATDVGKDGYDMGDISNEELTTEELEALKLMELACPPVPITGSTLRDMQAVIKEG